MRQNQAEPAAAASLGREISASLGQITLHKVSEVGLANAKANGPRIASGRSILALRETPLARGTDALVIAAGPSLHRFDVAEIIRDSGYRGTIIATESAMSWCLRNEIVPDLVVTLDPHPTRIVRWFGDPMLDEDKLRQDDYHARQDNDYFARQDMDPQFREEHLRSNAELLALVDAHARRIRIAIASSASEAVASRVESAGMEAYWWNPMYNDYGAPNSLTRRIRDMNGLPCVNAGGNVGSACWVFAHAVLGKTRIGLVGVDFGYYQDTPYERTQYYRETVSLVGRDRLEEVYVQIHNPFVDKDFFTDPAYLWYRDSFLEMVETAPCTTFNCTGGGILFGPGITWSGLAEFLRLGTAELREPAMAKILFINPTVRMEDKPRHVPYGIALLASIAMRDGHLVQVYDANAWRLGDDVLREVIEADDWDVVATGGITTTYGQVKTICRIAAESAPNALVVLGGGILTSIPNDMMRLIPEVHVGVIGEAFVTFPALLKAVDEGTRDWQGIAGLIYRAAEDGRLVITPQRGLIQDLDSLPMPAYELFPLEEVYFPNSQVLFSEEGMVARRRLDINASYGCSLVCKFCFHLGIAGDMKYVEDGAGQTSVLFDSPRSFTRDIRWHDPRYIVSMVKALRERYSIDFVGFLDENLMTMDQYSGRTWMKAICELWIAEGLQPSCVRDGVPHDESCLGVHWSGTSHATLCTKEILQLMRRAGCSHLVYGYESFSTQIMKRLGKGASPETNVRSFHWTMEAGIRPIPNQIMGFPSEDFDSLRDSMHAWEQLGIVVKPFFATPYPGSTWYQVYRERILEQYDNDMDKFLLALGDATNVTANISENFNAVELYGLRELMVRFDWGKIAKFEAQWHQLHPGADAERAADERELQAIARVGQLTMLPGPAAAGSARG